MTERKPDFEKRYTALKRRLFERAYCDLNAEQFRAVTSVTGPLLVLAGAGSGKTTVLVKRIVHIIKYGTAYESEYVPEDADENTLIRFEYALSEMQPREIEKLILGGFAENPCPTWAILAITFTNKAAGEIKSRLAAAFPEGEQINGSSTSDIWAGTFHSVCMRILRRYGDYIGCRSGFTIYDTDDTKRLISESMKELQIDEKTLPVRSVMNEISRAKDKLLSPDDFAEAAGGDFRRGKIAEIYRQYEARLEASNALDFDDIIFKTVNLLRDFPDVREKYNRQFRYVSVDEYQDTNRAQFELTKLLTGSHSNLMVVGDDDQSIYKFRGATIENILSFDKSFGDAKIIKLEQNYRSTANILNAANAVIGHNSERRGKKLWTDLGEGAKITFSELSDQNAEARYIAGKISSLAEAGEASYRDIAVLYRMNAQSQPIEAAFAKAGIPYRMLGGLRFYDRKEIRDVIAYLSVILNPSDTMRLSRIINEPKRKIGITAVNAAKDIADAEGTYLYDVLTRADSYMALKRSAPAIAEFVRIIETLREFSESASVAETIDRTLELTGYREMLIAAGDVERDRLENIEQLISNAYEYDSGENPTLLGFLEDAALVSDIDKYDETADAVVMMTIHSAKGLEFPYVFLPGLEDGIFPGMQSIMSISDGEIEEERRLAYVAITRAKKRLFITKAHQRMLYGQSRYNPTSRFVGEIPKELIDDETSPDAGYGAGAPRRRETFTFGNQRKVPTKEKYPQGAGVKVDLTPGKTTPAEVFAVGDAVKHMKFGRGEIISVTEVGGDYMYEIIFDEVGTKKLMASYARLKRADTEPNQA
ncbi:MAG: UvrD-helicase domain-containing protein [Firmicutes bacterium]|nr:UvrD-helicase domain-containing protein [Bacillota bacterium]